MKPVLGTTRRGHAVYPVHHESYGHLERTRHLGSSPSELSQMARLAHPHYRAVDHEEASQMHHAVGNFHAARAHEAASAEMSKSTVLQSTDPLASVYAAVDPTMTPQDAADIGNLLMPDWTPSQHREVGLAKQALAQTFLGSDKPGHENEAMQAMAAAFVHLSAAGQQPTACITTLDDDAPVLAVADDGLVNGAGVMKSGGILGTTKFGQAVHVGEPLPVHNDKSTSAAVAHGKHIAGTHPTYNKQDHFDASAMHARAAKTHGVSTPQGKHHLAMANAHIFAAPLKKSLTPRKAQSMITLDESKLSKAAKYGVKPLGTTLSGKTVHGLRNNMNAPIANGIISAGKKADPGAMAHHIHQFNPTFTHSDHHDAAIHHKTEAAVLRGKGKAGLASGSFARQQAGKQHLEHAERHTALSMAHYHAAKATGRGTGPSRKGLTAMKSEAETFLADYLKKAQTSPKPAATTASGAVIHSPTHEGYKGVSDALHHTKAINMAGEKAVNKLHAPVVQKLYPSYSKQDHYDAYRHHEGNNQHAIAGAHFAAAGVYNKKDRGTLKRSMSKAEKGEGSRGGKVVGHTRSGRPIYAVDHTRHELMNSNNQIKQGHYLAMTHPKYSPQDHKDASAHYEKVSKKLDGKDALSAHHLAVAHYRAHEIKDSGEFNAIRNTGKKGSTPATKEHWAAANHFNKKFATDRARDEIRRTEKSMTVVKSEAWMDLFKAASKGEGSRGGKVVGHTKSGKPIYAASGAKYKGMEEGPSIGSHNANRETYDERDKVNIRNASHVQAKHPGYTAEDHIDAARFHEDDNNHHAAGAHHAAAGYYDHSFHSDDVRAYSKEHVKANGSGGAEAKKETVAKKPRKAVSGKRSIGYDVAKPKTDTGKAIPVDGSSKYKALNHDERQEAISKDYGGRTSSASNAKHVTALANKDADAMAHHFKGWSKQDHQDAADHHEDGNYHQASMAHQVLADRMDAKKSLRLNLDTLALAKGFLVPPSTYFWGAPQQRVS